MDANERRERARADAAEWWSHLQADDMSRATREQFVDWLRESTVHVAEMLRVAQVHNALEKFENWTSVSTAGGVEEDTVVEFPLRPLEKMVQPGEVARLQRQRKGVRFAAIAASVLSIMIAGTWYWSGAGRQIIETERGERREMVLNDGSVIQIDPETRLRVKFQEKTRQIVLERGRVLFRVAKQANRPFMVKADNTVVRAIGTAFGVERKSQEVTVTVSEGKVAVLSHAVDRSALPLRPVSSSNGRPSELGKVETALLPDRKEHQGLFLTANQQVTVQRFGAAKPIRQVDSSRELAWAEGRLMFENTPVAEVVGDFNRYNRVQLRVADARLAGRAVSGVFNAADPESFIAFLQTVTQVRVVRGDGQHIEIASTN